jgi:hypothetical protein
MLPRLTAAEYRGEHRIRIAFADGVEGEVDLWSELFGEVFEPLKDPGVFRQVRLDKELGTVVWPTGADFAPEFLYQKLRPDDPPKGPSRTGAA